MTMTLTTNLAPHFVNNDFRGGGGRLFQSINPATGSPIWEGPQAGPDEVDGALRSARKAFPGWSQTSLQERKGFLKTYARVLQKRQQDLIKAICLEVGKPPWEAAAEINAMIAKIDLSIAAYADRCADFGGGPASAVTRFKPHGVVAVFGPFNFPGHLPNGHLAPALLAGNTVVFKPSEQAPKVAQCMAKCFLEAGFPGGVFNMIQGAAPTGALLAAHAEIDGLFFTGSSSTGLALRKLLAFQPEKILALEMGGNNPLIVHQTGGKEAAALLIIQSAYITTGQRCTCARRLILPQGIEADELIEVLISMMGKIKVGGPDAIPEPFMGPVISPAAARNLLQAQEEMISNGGRALVPAEILKPDTGLISPALVDVTKMEKREDKECFGPLLQLIRVKDFEDAVAEANRTQYGLAAGLLSDNESLYKYFNDNVRAGIINWNRPLTGASGSAPFGGVGRSGNHRPAGYFAADFCSYPVASLETPRLEKPPPLPPGLS